MANAPSSAAAQGTAKTKIDAALLYKSLRKTQETTLSPPNLSAGGQTNYPNLSRGIIHLRHWLNLNLTVNIANSTTAAVVAGGTVSPNGALDWLTQIRYSANTISNFIVLSGAQAFKIGMWQMGVDASVNGGHNSIFQNDGLFGIPTASIPASGSSNFTANINIPINFSGTHTNTPNMLGFSTLNPAITSFQIDANFGTVASVISGLASGLTATISAGSVTIISEYYPPNYFPVSSAYEPLYYTGLALANQNSTTGATTKGTLGGIPYGAGYVYKSMYAFIEDTSTTPYNTPSDNILEQINLYYNTSNYIINNLPASLLKAEAQYIGNSSVATGMYPIPLIYQGNLTDSFNTKGLSSFELGFQTSAAGSVTLIGETVNDNIAA